MFQKTETKFHIASLESTEIMAGITSTEIYLRSEPSLLPNYCSVYAIDELVEKFVECTKKILRGISSKLPFAIVNTDPIAKDGTHWVSLIKLQDHSFFLFDSFGLLGFSQFIVSNDQELILQFLTKFKTYTHRATSSTTLLNSMPTHSYLSLKKQRKSLSDTFQGLMLFITASAIATNTKTINVYGLHDQFQLKTTSTCAAFVLYFLSKVYTNATKKICKVKTCTIFIIREIISSSFPNTGTPAGRMQVLPERTKCWHVRFRPYHYNRIS